MLGRLKDTFGHALVGLGNRLLSEARQSASMPWVHLPFDSETQTLWSRIESRTMTSIERVDALRQSVEYIQANLIPGDIVECGVWRGGSMMAAALVLLRLNGHGLRRLWLYDTFSGMTPPGVEDVDFQGRAASDWLAREDPETSIFWGKSAVEDVRGAIAETGYPLELVEFIVGPVETTIPLHIPVRIALLRLDTDWFSSTYHELAHLWPRLAVHGVLIIDDYGDWAGAKQAVDQYFQELGIRPFLHRIDGAARLVIKSAY